MYRAKVAEWLLSLTTSPERAASTAGDLAQESATRGTFWFWRSLVGIAGSLVLREWATRPLRMTGLALAASLINTVLFVFSFAAIVVVIEIALGGTRLLGLDWNVDIYIASWWTKASVALSQILIGRWLARRSPGKELPACLAFVLLDTVVWVLFAGMVQRISQQPFDPADLVMMPITNVVTGMFLLYGVDQVRERSVRAM
jgi:hypothetical protein